MAKAAMGPELETYMRKRRAAAADPQTDEEAQRPHPVSDAFMGPRTAKDDETRVLNYFADDDAAVQRSLARARPPQRRQPYRGGQ